MVKPDQFFLGICLHPQALGYAFGEVAKAPARPLSGLQVLGPPGKQIQQFLLEQFPDLLCTVVLENLPSAFFCQQQEQGLFLEWVTPDCVHQLASAATPNQLFITLEDLRQLRSTVARRCFWRSFLTRLWSHLHMQSSVWQPDKLCVIISLPLFLGYSTIESLAQELQSLALQDFLIVFNPEPLAFLARFCGPFQPNADFPGLQWHEQGTADNHEVEVQLAPATTAPANSSAKPSPLLAAAGSTLLGLYLQHKLPHYSLRRELKFLVTAPHGPLLPLNSQSPQRILLEYDTDIATDQMLYLYAGYGPQWTAEHLCCCQKLMVDHLALKANQGRLAILLEQPYPSVYCCSLLYPHTLQRQVRRFSFAF